MENLKSALKNIGWMILAMALVQALSLLIRPVTASEQSYQAISYGDNITDDGSIYSNSNCDEDGEDCVTHDSSESTCVWYDSTEGQNNAGYSCSCDALTEEEIEDQIECDDDYTGDYDHEQYLFTKEANRLL